MDQEERDFRQKEGFWLKAATWTFGLWALMLPITGKLVIDSIRDVADEQKNTTSEFIKYREIQEKRMTIVEERQNVIMRRLEQIDTDHRNGINHK